MKNKELRPGQITAYVTGEIKLAKKKLGIDWRGLIVRGIRAATINPDEETAKIEKIAKLSQKVTELSQKIWKLENKENE